MGTYLDLDKVAGEGEISIILPVYNESRRIEANLENLLETLSGLDRSFEVILVNDGSTDDTLEKIQHLVEKHPNIILLSYKKNKGRGYAIRQAFRQARGQILVVTESDLSYGTNIITQLVEKMEVENLDVVVASPYSRGGALINVPLIRRFYSIMGNRLLRLLMPLKLSVYTGMTRAYRREVVKSLDLESDDKELHLEILIKVSHLGYRIGEIPATLRWEPSRRRKGTFKARKYIKSHLIFGFMQAPFKIMAYLSVFLFTVGTFSGIYLFIVSLRGNPVADRPLLLFSVFCIIVGFFVLLLGFLAQQNINLERQLHRLYKAISKRKDDDL